jgi:hypothetical protein
VSISSVSMVLGSPASGSFRELQVPLLPLVSSRFEVFAKVRVVKAIPSCGGNQSFSTSTMFKSCTLRRHLHFLDFGCNLSLSSLVHSANSPNATPLHSSCI